MGLDVCGIRDEPQRLSPPHRRPKVVKMRSNTPMRLQWTPLHPGAYENMAMTLNGAIGVARFTNSAVTGDGTPDGVSARRR